MQKPKSSHTDVRFEKRHRFTLIELLVVISQHCRDFFKRFICTDKYGCVRKHTESAALKNTPHHTCKASASCLPQANASCSNAALHTAEPVPDCSLVPVVERQQSKKIVRFETKVYFSKKKCIYFC